MRFLVMAFATFACVATASAQETVSIPFAPPIPSAYVIDEVRTMTIQRDQVTKVSTGRLRYRLEIRAHDGSYQAGWTLVSMENSGAFEATSVSPIWPLPRQLVEVTAELTLGAAGQPRTVNNLDKLNDALFAEAGEQPEWAEDAGRIAAIVAAPLTFIAPCQNANLQVGVPDRNQSRDVHGEYVSTVAISRELQPTSQSDSARITFSRAQTMRRTDAPADAPALSTLTISSDCTVDRRNGVVLGAIADMHGQSDGEDVFAMHSELRVTPQ